MVNVRGTERTMVDPEAVLTIHREGEPLADDLSVPEDSECRVWGGRGGFFLGWFYKGTFGGSLLRSRYLLGNRLVDV